ncbi:hypothetical protein AGMMS50268_31900 [Spirochaetia bacterium]|nr:hypothetical protein AGMMS50268_31900 [Spirochaetia bacterium]
MTETIKINIIGDKVFVTQRGPDGRMATTEKRLEPDHKLTVLFMEECMKAGFSMREAWEEIGDAIMKIFECGFIPAEDEFYELTEEQYASFHIQFPGNIEKKGERIFMLLPKNPAYQSSSQEVSVISESQLVWFRKAERVIRQYRRDFGMGFCSVDEELTWLATMMPKLFSQGTRIRRNLLRKVK